jgi:hypothetical protein
MSPSLYVIFPFKDTAMRWALVFIGAILFICLRMSC